ncbi:hypothetical protein VP01_323g1 [Puccinia sorghi]|uniref:Uncharacterized protein n=1 Tax=Puccinia sorghi TaxID=27349 RepID=A0A0L6UY65_9BASI|nr:hypothetical protein VP01_323g1 [Puccinia sorghi]
MICITLTGIFGSKCYADLIGQTNSFFLPKEEDLLLIGRFHYRLTSLLEGYLGWLVNLNPQAAWTLLAAVISHLPGCHWQLCRLPSSPNGPSHPFMLLQCECHHPFSRKMRVGQAHFVTHLGVFELLGLCLSNLIDVLILEKGSTDLFHHQSLVYQTKRKKKGKKFIMSNPENWPSSSLRSSPSKVRGIHVRAICITLSLSDSSVTECDCYFPHVWHGATKLSKGSVVQVCKLHSWSPVDFDHIPYPFPLAATEHPNPLDPSSSNTTPTTINPHFIQIFTHITWVFSSPVRKIATHIAWAFDSSIRFNLTFQIEYTVDNSFCLCPVPLFLKSPSPHINITCPFTKRHQKETICLGNSSCYIIRIVAVNLNVIFNNSYIQHNS